MLDIIEPVLKNSGIKLVRLDGDTPNNQRQKIVNRFNNDTSIDVCLLSTKAGGEGLTLTGASSVIVYDLSWSPSEDEQAIHRAYRFGQTKRVSAYYFVTAGTVEEKMYGRQINKTGVRLSILTEGAPLGKFTDQKELRAIFDQQPAPRQCPMLQTLQEKRPDTIIQESEEHEMLLEHRAVIGMAKHSVIYEENKRKRKFRRGRKSLQMDTTRPKQKDGDQEAAEEAANAKKPRLDE